MFSSILTCLVEALAAGLRQDKMEENLYFKIIKIFILHSKYFYLERNIEHTVITVHNNATCKGLKFIIGENSEDLEGSFKNDVL